MTDELNFMTAQELARHPDRELSAVEVLQAHLDQIDRVNPVINAIVTLLPERALADARAADAALARGDESVHCTASPSPIRTHSPPRASAPQGSPIYVDAVPDENALIVERIQGAGAIPIGKTNVRSSARARRRSTPSSARRSIPTTYEDARWVLRRGRRAATGMHPIADGSDLGGSLRNPGGYCNVVGFRPSPGRVPKVNTKSAWFDMTVNGPLARTVGDIALMMSVIAGPDLRSPITLEDRARSSPGRSSAISGGSALPGAATWAGSRSIRAPRRCSSPSAPSSPTWASISSRPRPT